jgi:hypothetical protein
MLYNGSSQADNLNTAAAVSAKAQAPRPSLQPAALLAKWDGFGSNQERRAWGEALSREDRALLVNALGSRIMEHAKAWPIRA